jgi:hypothetical protein
VRRASRANGGWLLVLHDLSPARQDLVTAVMHDLRNS